jgi:predicted O-linked N-acetylglucosamine transferase (SPINDLY family)
MGVATIAVNVFIQTIADKTGYIDSPEAKFAEETLYLPDSFWCFDPMTVETEPNELPALTAGHVTFGCTNNFGKITGLTLDLWSAVMNAVPGSTLLLRAPSEGARRRVLDRLAQNGISRERVEFAGKLPRQDYWKFYHRIDINLDATPYNGHVTTMDSLYMGVPMVSLAGGMPLARAGYSILSNVGLGDFAAHERGRFVEIAVAAANDLTRLSELRATLRDRMKRSPMMDAAGFTRNIEKLYRQAWRKWCANR